MAIIFAFSKHITAEIDKAGDHEVAPLAAKLAVIQQVILHEIVIKLAKSMMLENVRKDLDIEQHRSKHQQKLWFGH